MSKDPPTIEQLEAENQVRLAPFRSKYPALFSELKGMYIEPGWDNLMLGLCESIAQYIQFYVPDELQDQIYFVQIKQKFGGIIVYMSEHIPYIQGAISVVENISFSVCEKCGNTAQTHNVRSWITTLCPVHHKEAMERL